MCRKWILMVVLGLVTTIPALSDNTAEKAANVAAPAKKEKEVSKKSEELKSQGSSPREDSAVELELRQLRELVLQQQQKVEALEEQLNTIRAKAESTATTASNPGSLPVALESLAQNQDEFSGKVNKTEKDLADTKKSVEGKIKGFGPFSFSGDFRLRDEPIFGGPSNQSQVRNRERFRLRFNANAKLNDDISGGLSLASGDLNDPISTNQTTNQFYTRKPFTLDRAFVNYNPQFFKPLTLSGGKFGYPWYRTELTWDNDLNPEGLAQTLAFNVETPVLKKVALVGFELPFAEVAGVSLNNRSIVQSVVYGGQIQTSWQFGKRLKFGAYTAFYNYHNADPIAFALATANSASPVNGLLRLGGSSVQNSIGTVKNTAGTVSSAQFASKFALLDTIARFDFQGRYSRWPVAVLGDFVQNTRACANVGNIAAPPPGSTLTSNAPCKPRERRGYWLEARFGRTQEKGDWQFAYTRVFIEREAVMGAFNFSDLRQNSNVSQHRVEVFYQAYKNIQLAFTGLFGRPLNFGSSTPPEDILKRLQFDVICKF